MDVPLPPPEIVNNKERRQFEIHVGDMLARLKYRIGEDTMELIHTEVPKALAGRGLAGQLAQTALEYAAAHRLQVIPTCPYVQTYLKRHPDYSKLTERRDD